MKNFSALFLVLFFVLFGCDTLTHTSTIVAQENSKSSDQPKLVVGIIVDQMRSDFIYKYWEDLSDDGFKRLINQGFECKNHHYSYAPTFTGPGHASVYSGTTPTIHGIISNYWYDIESGNNVYCASDSLVKSVGTNGADGQMSPYRMLSTTISDEMRFASNFRSKTIGISLKDRGAVLPAGHTANAAYWYVGKNEGSWVTSNHYMDSLPNWVNEFNASSISDDFLNQNWDLLLDASAYDESLPDNNAHESAFKGTLRPVFPYDLKTLRQSNGNFELLKAIPFGNSLTLEFAKKAIVAEDLGSDEFIDMLALSFSSTDYVGHQFGPDSRETQDTYLRLDRDIAELLRFLDEQIGKGKYTVFLTADHGAATVPSYVHKRKVPSNYWNSAVIEADVKENLSKKYGPGDYIKNYSNDQFFLDRELINALGLNIEDIEKDIRNWALEYEGVQMAFTRTNMLTNQYNEGIPKLIQKGYHPKSSGDVIIVLKPEWIEYGPTGTTHGSPYPYDTHVPLIFYGAGINNGSLFDRTSVEDIAPTISSLLNIQFPNGCIGNPISPVIR